MGQIENILFWDGENNVYINIKWNRLLYSLDIIIILNIKFNAFKLNKLNIYSTYNFI